MKQEEIEFSKEHFLHFNVPIAPGFETTLGYCDALSVNTK